MNIRINYILFIANRIYSRNGGANLFENDIFSDILDLDADFIAITDNLIDSATNSARLISNFKITRIGKTEAKIVDILVIIMLEV